MKRGLSSYYITHAHKSQVLKLFLAVSLAIFVSFAPVNSALASANDFYFEDFTADYYLTRAEDGSSKLHIKEILTAIFPETNQNHGITRAIPFTNQGGTNLTIESESAMNLTVLRNGLPENIANIEREDNSYLIYIGDADIYVHGRQIYTIEYDFTNVVTEFDENNNNVSGESAVATFQELYWNTTGTGWSQRFDSLTANLHLPSDLVVTPDNVWCYVGYYGISGRERCNIIATEDGFSFSATDLRASENLTFAIDFEPNFFRVYKLTSDFVLYVFVIGVIVIAFFVVIGLRRYQKLGKENYYLYKSKFVAPEFTVPTNFHVAEAEQLYAKNVRRSQVATLLELAVSRKISIKQGEKKKSWSILVNDGYGLTTPQTTILQIINGGNPVSAGKLIPVVRHTATAKLERLSKSYSTSAIADLQSKGLLKDKLNDTTTTAIFAGVALFIYALFASVAAEDLTLGRTVLYTELIPIIVAVLLAGFVVVCHFDRRTSKFAKYTKDGIKAARQLEGLRLYIGMAEKERLNLFQSTKGTDTTPEGIIHLYEKLLPYACLFGLENSWMKELSKYYEAAELSPDWYDGTDMLGFAMLNSFTHVTNSYITTSTSYSSSSSSGGGGGGFSGGGGGGGGGGGW